MPRGSKRSKAQAINGKRAAHVQAAAARREADNPTETAAKELELEPTAATDVEAPEAFLLGLGDGSTNDAEGCVTLPDEMCLPEGADVAALTTWVYPDLMNNCSDINWLSERAILTPLNTVVDEINRDLGDAFPGAAWDCPSADHVAEADACAVSVEFLNTLNPPNFPAHRLKLKKGMPLMLLRNLSPPDGLCNGTRLILHEVINGHLLHCQIATKGKHLGDFVFIPRLTLDADKDAFPFSWSRRQFPVRVAFAMTINKAQGQTLKCVGVYLPQPVFSHGQLYVAASRVGLPSRIRFAVARNDAAGAYRTRNVVYPEALTS